jgi:hypothetical protein
MWRILVGGVGALLLIYVLAMFAQQWTVRRIEHFCQEMNVGMPIEAFRTRGGAEGLRVMDSAKSPQKVDAVDTWLMLSVGCEASYDDRGVVTRLNVWSVD